MKPQSRKILLGVILPLLLGAILVVSILYGGGFAQANRTAEKPTEIDPILASLGKQIEQYDAALKKNDISPDTAKSIRAKKKYVEQQATERANYLGHQNEAFQVKLTAVENMTLTPYPTELPEKKPTSYDGPLTEFYAPMYREADFTTAWLIQTEKKHMFILAGSLVEDPDQGVIYIRNDDNRTLEKYKTPNKDGSLKIKNVDKNRVSLETKKGKKYFFDMEKKKFVDEMDNPLPEATPTPIPAYPSP